MKIFTLILYVATLLIANPARALERQILDVYDRAEIPLQQSYVDEAGERRRLGSSQSKLRIVNFWATWCQPCIEELPSLVWLDQQFDDRQIEVMTIAVKSKTPQEARDFLNRIGVKSLPSYVDPKAKLASEAGIYTVPYTIVLNAKGEEIARVVGIADWRDRSLVAGIKQLLSLQ